jgi:hypothetical protein
MPFLTGGNPFMSTTETPKEAAPSFRIDVGLHDMLKDSHALKDLDDPIGAVEGGLPEPVFPQYPDAPERWKTERAYNNFKRLRTWKGLGAPYFKSKMMPWELRPLISYLFSEWKCNLDCHYCWSYDNSIKGMTEPVAKRSIDWLHETGNRFLALMGGEPLLRPHFIHKITNYAAKKDFLVYLPTNGRLMKPDVIDRLGDAGLATVNLAGGRGQRETRACEGAGADPSVLRSFDEGAEEVRDFDVLQRLYLPHQHGRRERTHTNRKRSRYRNRLPHCRVPIDRLPAL